MEERKMEAICYLQNACETDRAKAFLNFAMERDLDKAVFTDASGKEHLAVELAMHMICHTEQVAQKVVGNDYVTANAESICISALLVALESTMPGPWSFGSELLFSLRQNGLMASREEVAAFLATEGTFDSNKNKGNIMEQFRLATFIYAGFMLAKLNSLPGAGKWNDTTVLDNAEMITELPLVEGSDKEVLESLVMEFLPAYVGSEETVRNMLNYLASTDFYQAPASTRYHLCVPGGLAKHELHVILRLAQLLLPAPKPLVGEFIAAGFGHDLCKNQFYSAEYKNQKVYCEEGSRRDKGGAFEWRSYIGYSISDKMPFGHGRKSAYMMAGFLGKALTESVASAIDCHMYDPSENPNVDKQMIAQPLGLYLHIADTLAAHIDEAGTTGVFAFL